MKDLSVIDMLNNFMGEGDISDDNDVASSTPRIKERGINSQTKKLNDTGTIQHSSVRVDSAVTSGFSLQMNINGDTSGGINNQSNRHINSDNFCLQMNINGDTNGGIKQQSEMNNTSQTKPGFSLQMNINGDTAGSIDHQTGTSNRLPSSKSRKKKQSSPVDSNTNMKEIHSSTKTKSKPNVDSPSTHKTSESPSVRADVAKKESLSKIRPHSNNNSSSRQESNMNMDTPNEPVRNKLTANGHSKPMSRQPSDIKGESTRRQSHMNVKVDQKSTESSPPTNGFTLSLNDDQSLARRKSAPNRESKPKLHDDDSVKKQTTKDAAVIRVRPANSESTSATRRQSKLDNEKSVFRRESYMNSDTSPNRKQSTIGKKLVHGSIAPKSDTNKSDSSITKEAKPFNRRTSHLNDSESLNKTISKPKSGISRDSRQTSPIKPVEKQSAWAAQKVNRVPSINKNNGNISERSSKVSQSYDSEDDLTLSLETLEDDEADGDVPKETPRVDSALLNYWSTFGDSLKKIDDKTEAFTLQPRKNFKASDRFKDVMTNMFGNSEYGKAKSYTLLKSKINRLANISSFTSKALAEISKGGDSEEEEEDAEERELAEKKSMVSEIKGAKRGWKLLRRQVKEDAMTETVKDSNVKWSMIRHHVSSMSDIERARQDLYERYGLAPAQQEDGSVQCKNVMWSKRAVALNQCDPKFYKINLNKDGKKKKKRIQSARPATATGSDNNVTLKPSSAQPGFRHLSTSRPGSRSSKS